MVCLLIFSFCRCEEVAACSRTRRGGGRGMAPFIGSRGSFSFFIVVGNCDFVLIDFSLFPFMVVDCDVADVEMDRPLHQEQMFDPCDGRSWS